MRRQILQKRLKRSVVCYSLCGTRFVKVVTEIPKSLNLSSRGYDLNPYEIRFKLDICNRRILEEVPRGISSSVPDEYILRTASFLPIGND
jgi:hypothetical protein